jgi:hypothetical protein
MTPNAFDPNDLAEYFPGNNCIPEHDFHNENFDFDHGLLSDPVDTSPPQLEIHHDMAMMPTGASLSDLLDEVAIFQVADLYPKPTAAVQATSTYAMTMDEFQNALAMCWNRIRQQSDLVGRLQGSIAKAYQDLERLREQFSQSSPIRDRYLHTASDPTTFIQDTSTTTDPNTNLAVLPSIDPVSPFSTGRSDISTWSDSGYMTSFTNADTPESEGYQNNGVRDLSQAFYK